MDRHDTENPEYGIGSVEDILAEFYGSAQTTDEGAADYADYAGYTTDGGAADYAEYNTDGGAADYAEYATDGGAAGYAEYNTDEGAADYADYTTDEGAADYADYAGYTTDGGAADYAGYATDEGAADYADYTEYATDEEYINPGFRMYGRSEKMSYAGEELDLSAEEGYSPAAGEFIPSHAGAEEPYELAVEELEQKRLSAEEAAEEYARQQRRGRGGLGRIFSRRHRAAEQEPETAESDSTLPGDETRVFNISFQDYRAEDYAPEEDYELSEEETRLLDDGFPTFSEFVLNELSTLLLRFTGVQTEPSSATMQETDEELGAEVSVKAAGRHYSAYSRTLCLRSRIALALLIIMAYISVGLPLPGALRQTTVQAAACLALQLVLMLVCLDVLVNALTKLARGRLGADVLAALCCLLSSLDAFLAAKGLLVSPHVPLCVLSSLSLTGVLFSSMLSVAGLKRSMTVPFKGEKGQGAASAKAVSGVNNIVDRGMTLLRSYRPISGFVRRCEERAPDETLFLHISPFILLGAALLSVIVCTVKGGWNDFLFVFTAILSPAVPVTALLCFAIPFCAGAFTISRSGAAIAGWSGLCDVGRSRTIIVNDKDLFPDDSVKILQAYLISDDSPSDLSAETAAAYAGTMLTASGSGLADCFAALMEDRGCSLRPVEDFSVLSGGGMQGLIDGQRVICGSASLMCLMHILIPGGSDREIVRGRRIPCTAAALMRMTRQIGSEGYDAKTAVYLAVDGVLRCVFFMCYTPQPRVRRALVSLMRSNRHAVFAVRDFNITPEMLRRCFELPTDGYDFPPYEKRFDMSGAQPEAGSSIAALVYREGLGPLTHMAATGRGMYLVTRFNILLTLIGMAAGCLTVFVRFLSVGFISVGFMLLFMLLLLLPVTLSSLALKM